MAAPSGATDGELEGVTAKLAGQRLACDARAAAKGGVEECGASGSAGRPQEPQIDGKHASDAESGEEDDWETQLEQGALKQSFGTVQGVGGEHELGQHRNVPRWSDVILGEDEELETEPGPACDPSKPRPRTTTAVARRLLAHALNKPELIARGEERELQVLRDRNKQARKDRREQLDSVWGEN